MLKNAMELMNMNKFMEKIFQFRQGDEILQSQYNEEYEAMNKRYNALREVSLREVVGLSFEEVSLKIQEVNALLRELGSELESLSPTITMLIRQMQQQQPPPVSNPKPGIEIEVQSWWILCPVCLQLFKGGLLHSIGHNEDDLSQSLSVCGECLLTKWEEEEVA